jgi:hypothetical protein
MKGLRNKPFPSLGRTAELNYAWMLVQARCTNAMIYPAGLDRDAFGVWVVVMDMGPNRVSSMGTGMSIEEACADLISSKSPGTFYDQNVNTLIDLKNTLVLEGWSSPYLAMQEMLHGIWRSVPSGGEPEDIDRLGAQLDLMVLP